MILLHKIWVLPGSQFFLPMAQKTCAEDHVTSFQQCTLCFILNTKVINLAKQKNTVFGGKLNWVSTQELAGFSTTFCFCFCFLFRATLLTIQENTVKSEGMSYWVWICPQYITDTHISIMKQQEWTMDKNYLTSFKMPHLLPWVLWGYWWLWVWLRRCGRICFFIYRAWLALTVRKCTPWWNVPICYQHSKKSAKMTSEC